MQEPTPARELDAYGPGQVIDDFQLIREIGSSAESRVFLAYQRSMQRSVALRISAGLRADVVEFGQFEHPHIVRIYDQRHLRDGKLSLLYMQHHPGGDLKQVMQVLRQLPDEKWNGQRFLQILDEHLRESEAEPPSDSLQRERIETLSWPQWVGLLGTQLAAALDHAHRHGFFHGNLSNDHVVFSETAMPQLLRMIPMESGEAGERQAQQDVRGLVELLGGLLPDAPASASDVGQLLNRFDAMGDASRDGDELVELSHQLQIATDPDTARLLMPPTRPLRRLAGRAPLAVIVLTLLVPNVVAGVFNYIYNYESIIVPLHADRTFQRVMLLINAVAYPGALLVGLLLVRGLCKEVRERFARGAPHPANASLRSNCLAVPHQLALLGIACWCLAGIAYPAVLRGAGIQLSGVDAVHFFGSLALCGLIGAAYPFFGAAAVVTNVWYPALIRPELPPAEDREPLERLERLSSFYLILAGAVPLLGLAILAIWGQTEQRLPLGILSGGGACLLVIVFGMFRTIVRDLGTLKKWLGRK